MFVNPVTRNIQHLLLTATLLLTAGTALASPKIEHWTLANGARVYFVEARNLPMVTLNVVFDAGSARDSQQRSGLSMLTNHLLDHGTGDLDADTIAHPLRRALHHPARAGIHDIRAHGPRGRAPLDALRPQRGLSKDLTAEPEEPDPEEAQTHDHKLYGVGSGRPASQNIPSFDL